MKLKQLALMGVMMSSGMLGVASQAHADLNIDPTFTPSILLYADPNPSALGTSDVEGFIAAAGWGTFDLGLAYKAEADGGAEYGNGQAYYSTTYNPLADPSSATISWNNPMAYIDCGNCFLVVKDGNSSPYAYIFDISDDWNGQETINLSGFWPQKGAISYVAIYNDAGMGDDGGGTIAAIPEPETYAMLLAGLGLVGFAARRKIARTA